MKEREELLLKVIHLMSEHFREHIVLEGGMLLRLLNSPRATQDVDYLLVSESSKKDLAKEIKKVLAKIDDIAVDDVKLNSRGVFIGLTCARSPAIKAFLEVNVVPALLKPPSSISTSMLAGKYSMTARVISSMDVSEAFAHKVAAALQRDSIRDLYDIMILESLCDIDIDILKKRLSSLSIKREKAVKLDMIEAAEMLRKRAADITPEKVKKELGAWLASSELTGMDLAIRSAVMRLVQKISVIR